MNHGNRIMRIARPPRGRRRRRSVGHTGARLVARHWKAVVAITFGAALVAAIAGFLMLVNDPAWGLIG